jgi:hypothetical protein
MSRRRKAKRLTRRIERKVVAVNTRDDGSQRFILWFGAYGTTYLMVWANHLEDALDECIDWLADNAPGHLVDDQVNEDYAAAIAAGKSEEEAIEEAESDTTSGGNAGHYILSHEWGIVRENPSRADVLEIEGRPAERRARGVDRLAAKRAKIWRRR